MIKVIYDHASVWQQILQEIGNTLYQYFINLFIAQQTNRND